MENKEEISDALEEFCRLPNCAVPSVLEDYLCRVATTGITQFPWCKLKTLIRHKLDVVMSDFHKRVPMDSQAPCPNVDNVNFEQMHSRLLSAIDKFNGTPFTIQRICELITNPMKHYKKTDKFMRGIEKNLAVVTTVDPFGNRIVNESKSLVNGLDGSLEAQTSVADDSQIDSHSVEQSDSFTLPSVPVNSPFMSSADTSLASDSSPWLSTARSSAVESATYPGWRESVSPVPSSPTYSASRRKSDSESLDHDEDDEPPVKRRLVDDSQLPSSSDDDDSDQSASREVTPLLGQLLGTAADSSSAADADCTDVQQRRSVDSDCDVHAAVDYPDTVDSLESDYHLEASDESLSTNSSEADDSSHNVSSNSVANSDDSILEPEHCATSRHALTDSAVTSGAHEKSADDVVSSDVYSADADTVEDVVSKYAAHSEPCNDVDVTPTIVTDDEGSGDGRSYSKSNATSGCAGAACDGFVPESRVAMDTS